MGFHTKLECLLEKTAKAYQEQTLKLITETVNYSRYKFYDTGPRCQRRWLESNPQPWDGEVSVLLLCCHR
jgi:hypothetical protein